MSKSVSRKRAFWRQRRRGGYTQYFEVEILRKSRSGKRVEVAGHFGQRWVKPDSLEPGKTYRFG